ncbi:MAG: hypothetical protein MUP11_00120, partial [Anaerolineales bacterium]|nr:hypothetical protein [Anaerolineales bacterium]
MLETLPGPVVFAHRGSSADAPENTLSAFKLAVNQGAKAIELDVQLSADQSVIVFHDSSVDRVTDGSGKIKNLSSQLLKELDAGAAFSPKFSGEKIPTLEEVFDSIDSNILINIELKNLTSPFDNLPELVTELIKKHHAENQVLISSFNPISLMKFKELNPTIPIGRLLHNPISIFCFSRFPGMSVNYRSIHLPLTSVNPTRVRAFHQLRKFVFTYTLNNAQDILHALDCGVDGFFTDKPDAAK